MHLNSVDDILEIYGKERIEMELFNILSFVIRDESIFEDMKLKRIRVIPSKY
jgi:hypothetical protein